MVMILGGSAISGATNFSNFVANGTNFVATASNFSVVSGGVTTFNVDSSGRLTNPNRPMVYAYRNANAAWVNYGSGSNYVFNAAAINNGNCYNTSTGIFTCPVAGYYRVSTAALMGQAGGSSYFYFRKNGSNYGTPLHCNTTSYSLWPMSSNVWLVNCAVNDTLNIFATGSAANIYDGDHNHFIVELVG